MDAGITCIHKGHLTGMLPLHVKDLVFETDVAEFILTKLRIIIYLTKFRVMKVFKLKTNYSPCPFSPNTEF